jgi:hypothetical protein
MKASEWEMRVPVLSMPLAEVHKIIADLAAAENEAMVERNRRQTEKMHREHAEEALTLLIRDFDSWRASHPIMGIGLDTRAAIDKVFPSLPAKERE